MTTTSIIGYIKKRTVARDLTIALALTVALVVISVGLLNYFYSVREVEQELESTGTDIVERLSEILALPLWNIENDKIEQIAQVYIEKDEVIGLRILDEEEAVVFEKKRAENNAITRTRVIHHEDQGCVSSFWKVVKWVSKALVQSRGTYSI